MTFATGLLAASLLWFALGTIAITRFSVLVYKGIGEHMKAIRSQVELASSAAEDPTVTKALNEILAITNRVENV
jgi:hypothetical protein